MSREWRPGDVAIGGQDAWRGRLMWTGHLWIDEDGDEADEPHSIRPLVVIDAEDREQVERLIDCYVDVMQEDDRNSSKRGAVLKMQAALRGLLEPKPDEPTGRYAVVVDASGDEWVRTSEGPPSPWLRSGYFTSEQWTDYADIAAVRVLSEGVQS